jgi:hypothetical protein
MAKAAANVKSGPGEFKDRLLAVFDEFNDAKADGKITLHEGFSVCADIARVIETLADEASTDDAAYAQLTADVVWLVQYKVLALDLPFFKGLVGRIIRNQVPQIIPEIMVYIRPHFSLPQNG